MPPLPLRQSILSTLAFFHIFDAALTKEEVHRYLWRGGDITLESTEKELQELVTEGVIFTDRGYYALKTAHTALRINRIQYIEEKMKIAIRAAKWLRFVPFLGGVFVCNNLALETVSPESDVDVFIITKKDRIWTTRFLATLVLRLCGIARTKKRSINKVCLSFYVVDSALDFSTLPITDPDVYFMYWLRSIVPIYDPDNLFQTVQYKNKWVDSYIRSQPTPIMSKKWRVDENKLSHNIRTTLEKIWGGQIGDLIEVQTKEIQKTKMKFRFDSVRDEPDTRVIISDTMLKFHENDRRMQYKHLWEQNYEQATR